MTAADVDTAAVAMLTNELDAAVRRLAQPHDVPVLRDGRITSHRVPALVTQLRAAVATSGETGPTTAHRVDGRTPISIAAHDQLVQLDRDVAELHLEVLALAYAGMPAEQRLRAIAGVTAGWTDVEALAWVLQRVTRWSDGIVTLLDPPRRLHLTGACPRCGARMAWRRDDTTGDEVQVPALTVNLVDGAHCQVCHQRWTASPDQLHHLARILRQQDRDPAGVDETDLDVAGHIPAPRRPLDAP